MAEWDADSPELHDNLKRVLRRVCRDARHRASPSTEDARRWHVETMQKLQVPNPQFVGAFRGEPNLENIQVHIGGRYGVAACDVPAALNHFNDVLQRAVRRLDEWIPTDVELGPDQLAAIVEVCAWAHSEWVRIHPFANGNGRTARLWANSLAVSALAPSTRRSLCPRLRKSHARRSRPNRGFVPRTARKLSCLGRSRDVIRKGASTAARHPYPRGSMK